MRDVRKKDNSITKGHDYGSHINKISDNKICNGGTWGQLWSLHSFIYLVIQDSGITFSREAYNMILSNKYFLEVLLIARHGGTILWSNT